MRICNNCGTALKENETICPKCGEYCSKESLNDKAFYREEVNKAFRFAKAVRWFRTALWILLIGLMFSNSIVGAIFYIFTLIPLIVLTVFSFKFKSTAKSERYLKKHNRMDVIDKISSDLVVLSNGTFSANKDVIFQQKPGVVIPLDDVKEVLATDSPGKIVTVLFFLFSSLIIFLPFLLSKEMSMREDNVRFFMKDGTYLDLEVKQYEFARWLRSNPDALPKDTLVTGL